MLPLKFINIYLEFYMQKDIMLDRVLVGFLFPQPLQLCTRRRELPGFFFVVIYIIL